MSFCDNFFKEILRIFFLQMDRSTCRFVERCDRVATVAALFAYSAAYGHFALQSVEARFTFTSVLISETITG